MVETYDLELLMSVVRSGTLRGASKEIHLTQPAMTRRIQALEARVGVKLFVRAGRRLHLTEAGEEFIRRAAEILDRIQDLESEMAAFGRGQRGVLRIGATSTVCLYLLPPVLAEMRKSHPEYELFLSNESSRRMPDLVREGTVDVGIASIGTPLPGLHVTPWRKLHLGLLALDNNTPSPAPIGILEGAPLVINSSGSLRTAVEAALRAHAVTPRIVAQADSLEVVRMLVSCGFGLAVAPLEVLKEDADRSGLVLAPFIDDLAPLPVAIFYRRLTPPLKALLDIVREN